MFAKNIGRKAWIFLAVVGLLGLLAYGIRWWMDKSIVQKLSNWSSVQLDDYVINYESIDWDLCNIRVYHKGFFTNRLVYSLDSIERIDNIKVIDLDNDGSKEIFMSTYTGGAHCCFFYFVARLKDDKFVILDTIVGGHSEFEIDDIDKDSVKEIKGLNTAYAYAFVSFVESQYPIQIFQFKKDRFVDVTHHFPQEVRENLNIMKKELEEYVLNVTENGNYTCPPEDDERWISRDSTYSSDIMKAYLAPILEDYYVLNQWDSGVSYVRSIYKCDDADAFIRMVKREYIANREKGMIGFPDLEKLKKRRR